MAVIRELIPSLLKIAAQHLKHLKRHETGVFLVVIHVFVVLLLMTDGLCGNIFRSGLGPCREYPAAHMDLLASYSGLSLPGFC